MKKQIMLSLIVLTTIGLNQTVNAQNFEPLKYKPDIFEDEVIVCVNDISDNTTIRNEVNCKVFMADKDHERTISDIQKELYKEPFNDTFEMGLID